MTIALGKKILEILQWNVRDLEIRRQPFLLIHPVQPKLPGASRFDHVTRPVHRSLQTTWQRS